MRSKPIIHSNIIMQPGRMFVETEEPMVILSDDDFDMVTFIRVPAKMEKKKLKRKTTREVPCKSSSDRDLSMVEKNILKRKNTSQVPCNSSSEIVKRRTSYIDTPTQAPSTTAVESVAAAENLV